MNCYWLCKGDEVDTSFGFYEYADHVSILSSHLAALIPTSPTRKTPYVVSLDKACVSQLTAKGYIVFS